MRAEPVKKSSKRKKLVLVFVVLFIAWFLVSIYIGGKHQEQRLYKHGFRLLEEQIAVYIKENYSGISKVEFTDIYKYGSSGLFVYPIITDNHGNQTVLNDSINGAYGTLRGIHSLEFTEGGSEIIYLDNSANGTNIDVSDYQTLPDKAKVKESYITDRNFERLLKAGSIKGVEKSDKGSPDMKIVYNLKIKEK